MTFVSLECSPIFCPPNNLSHISWALFIPVCSRKTSPLITAHSDQNYVNSYCAFHSGTTLGINGLQYVLFFPLKLDCSFLEMITVGIIYYIDLIPCSGPLSLCPTHCQTRCWNKCVGGVVTLGRYSPSYSCRGWVEGVDSGSSRHHHGTCEDQILHFLWRGPERGLIPQDS